MTAHPHDDIEAFALGSLDEVSARRLLAHSDECPTCAVLLADAMAVVDGLETPGERRLAHAIGFVDLPRHRNVFGGPLATGPAWVMPLLAAIAACFVLIFGFDTVRNWGPKPFSVPVASLVHSHFEHHALHGAPGAGGAKVIQALDGRWLYLVADGLQAKTTYRLFETSGGSEREVGSFSTDARGQATGYWEQSPAKISGFTVAPSAAESKPAQTLRWP